MSTLHPSHTMELADLLQFLHDWLRHDHATLNQSLQAFLGVHGCYDTEQLRADLNRFTFLLGANDAEDLFHHTEHEQ